MAKLVQGSPGKGVFGGALYTEADEAGWAGAISSAESLAGIPCIPTNRATTLQHLAMHQDVDPASHDISFHDLRYRVRHCLLLVDYGCLSAVPPKSFLDTRLKTSWSYWENIYRIDFPSWLIR